MIIIVIIIVKQKNKALPVVVGKGECRLQEELNWELSDSFCSPIAGNFNIQTTDSGEKIRLHSEQKNFSSINSVIVLGQSSLTVFIFSIFNGRLLVLHLH